MARHDLGPISSRTLPTAHSWSVPGLIAMAVGLHRSVAHCLCVPVRNRVAQLVGEVVRYKDLHFF